MADFLGSAGSILGGLAAVAVLVLGATQTARLRRQERALREMLDSLEAKQKDVVTSLHRPAAARLVARQLFHPFRAVWPFLVWLTLAASAGDSGFLGIRYIWQTERTSFTGYVTAAFGDVTSLYLAVPVIFAFVPQVFMSYATTVRNRAVAAHDFYFDGRVSPGESFHDRQSREELEHLRRSRGEKRVRAPERSLKERLRELPGGVAFFFLLAAPGLFACSLGFLVGEMLAAKHYVPASLDPTKDPTNTPVFIAILATALSGMLLFFTCLRVREELREFDLPTMHPPDSPLSG